MKEEVGGCFVEILCRILDGIPAVLTGVMFFHIFVQKSAKTSQFQMFTFSHLSSQSDILK
jgi:ABC-type phosphate transport system permease subunit